MDLDRRACDRARQSRDARFDGRFFIAVTTTGIYCRPICPARAPKDEHVRYFPTAAAAEAEGFRPCFRCRPEASPGTPAWLGTSPIVSRALRLIGEGALDVDGIEALAGRVGVTGRHLRRLFLQHLGATPIAVAATRRAHFAKKLLDETTLPIGRIADAAGFGSLRRFNSQMRRTFARTPTELRRGVRPGGDDADCYRIRLTYRPPYDWDAALAFLAARATPGVEAVERGQYTRSIQVEGRTGTIAVSQAGAGHALDVEIRYPDPQKLLLIVERVRRVFDLGADPATIGEHLRADPLLRPLLAAHAGIRVPGAWDGFELAVRAILGQQVSVRAATTIAGRVASMFGSPIEAGGALDRIFPAAVQLERAALERAGVMPARAETIRALARRVVSGAVAFDAGPGDALAAIGDVPGIGGWTTKYIAMRAFGEPDAFPPGDLVLRRTAGELTAGELDRRSEIWRPWRAYAVILLWQSATDEARRMTAAQGAEPPRIVRKSRRGIRGREAWAP